MKKVCIVDDTEAVRTTVRILLSDKYEVIEAEGVESFFKLIEKEVPDIVLLDIMMPDGNGMVVKTKLKSDERFKHVPIVFLTAVEDERIKSVAKIQSEHYITKPFTKEELVSAIERVLKQ